MFELWERSLRRSQHRREITELARKRAARRKGAALAVSASMAAGPAAAPFAALASSGGRRSVRRRRGAARSAIAMPVRRPWSRYGDTGAAVAAVQRQVGVDDDGIFGPITAGAVQRFQKRYGLPVTGRVDAKTWQALFKSNVTYVGGGGKTVMTVYNGGGDRATPAPTTDGLRPSSASRAAPVDAEARHDDQAGRDGAEDRPTRRPTTRRRDASRRHDAGHHDARALDGRAGAGRARSPPRSAGP